jgi:hypothetical protein
MLWPLAEREVWDLQVRRADWITLYLRARSLAPVRTRGKESEFDLKPCTFQVGGCAVCLLFVCLVISLVVLGI